MKQGRIIETRSEAAGLIKLEVDGENKSVRFSLPDDCGGIDGRIVYSEVKEILYTADALIWPPVFKAITDWLFEVTPGWEVPNDVMRRCGVMLPNLGLGFDNVCVFGELPDDAIIRWEVGAFSGESPWTGLGFGHLNWCNERIPSTEFMIVVGDSRQRHGRR